MCGRTSLFADEATIADTFDIEVPTAVPPRYNVAPDDWLATVSTDDPTSLSRLDWGFVPRWADSPDAGPRPINARRESLQEAAPFRDAYRDRRCLVVVDGYYEWGETADGRQPYRFERRDRDPFALAGVWDRWAGEERSLETVAIVTAEAVSAVADVHDRMPVILAPGERREWLESAPSDPMDARLTPSWDEHFHRYPIGQRVNDPTNDDHSIIDALDASDRQGTLAEFEFTP